MYRAPLQDIKFALDQVIGTEAEELVATYTVGSRSVKGIRASHARFAQMSFAERHVLRMQLANELDDYRDLAANHAANADERIAAIRQTATLQVEMAEWLGHSPLAQALQETYAHAMVAYTNQMMGKYLGTILPTNTPPALTTAVWPTQVDFNALPRIMKSVQDFKNIPVIEVTDLTRKNL